MTIISILIAFALCHFIRELSQLRQRGWLKAWTGFANQSFSGLPRWSDVTGFLVIILVPAIVLVLLYIFFESTLGPAGEFLLALAVLVYTFGPRDLDSDVGAIVKAEDEEDRDEAIKRFIGGEPPEDEKACQAAVIDAVFLQSLRRWFGIIFWFAVLGIVGALLYRMVDWLQDQAFEVTDGQRDLVRGMQQIMDWPAAQLTTLALAVCDRFRCGLCGLEAIPR